MLNNYYKLEPLNKPSHDSVNFKSHTLHFIAKVIAFPFKGIFLEILKKSVIIKYDRKNFMYLNQQLTIKSN